MEDKNCEIAHERELREAWQQSHEARHSAEAQAVQLASRDINRRLDDMNELRRQIESERGKYLPREMYDREHDEMRNTVNVRFDSARVEVDSRLKILESSKSNLEGRLWAIGAMISAVVIAINLGLHFWGVK